MDYVGNSKVIYVSYTLERYDDRANLLWMDFLVTLELTVEHSRTIPLGKAKVKCFNNTTIDRLHLVPEIQFSYFSGIGKIR